MGVGLLKVEGGLSARPVLDIDWKFSFEMGRQILCYVVDVVFAMLRGTVILGSSAVDICGVDEC